VITTINLRDYLALKSERDALKAERDELVRALLDSPCPRPIDDDYSVADCISNGHCGCVNSTLARIDAKGDK
jgi:hypothetical protein